MTCSSSDSIRTFRSFC